MSWHLHDPGLWLTLGAWVAGAIGAWLVVRGVRGYRLGATACRACGYDVAGVVSGVCPECGREPGLDRRASRRFKWVTLALGIIAIGSFATQWWWVSPLADRIWAALPERALLRSFVLDGLEWREYGDRGSRVEARSEWPWWNSTAFVHHPLAGWIQVNDDRSRLQFGFAEDTPRSEQLDFTPRDLDADGIAERFVSAWSGGAHCCASLYIVNLANGVTPVCRIDGEHSGLSFEDRDGDGLAEVVLRDWTFAYWEWSFAGSPCPEVVLTMKDGPLRPLVSAMRKPRRESFDMVNVTLGSGDERPQVTNAPFWTDMLDMMYEGNEDQAWEFYDRIWPGESKAKREFRSGFLEQLESSKWWPMIRAGYRAETR